MGTSLLLRSFVSAQNLGHEEGIALFMSLPSKKGTRLESGVEIQDTLIHSEEFFS